jgi:hypothetical protein
MDGKVKRHITYHQSPTSPTPRRNYSHMGEEEHNEIILK